MSSRTSLPQIVAYARSGALDHAWKLFLASGYDTVEDDAAVIALRGRLLKDSGRAASGSTRREFYRDAADAYGRAGALSGQTYPLINAATLSLLAGERDKAKALARQILDHGEGDADETPYYRGATRAEALLLLGDVAAAKATLAQAIAAAPQAYEDHATTLRQFALILAELGEDASWLDAHRPPRVLHFAGHLGMAPDGGAAAAEIRRILEQEHVGFAFGALAAGADIVIAEALLERGAELNLILPTSTALFRATSVAHFGDDWAARFDAIVTRARSVSERGASDAAPSPLAIRLATEFAMGSTAMLAQTLATDAVQMIVVDPAVPLDGDTAALWAGSGRRQYLLAAPRARPAEPPAAKDGVLVAMLRIEPPSLEGLAAVAAALGAAASPRTGPRWSGDAVLVGYDSPIIAAEVALIVSQGMTDGGKIAGHYAVVQMHDDPFGGPRFASSPGAAVPAQIAPSVPPGAVYLSEDFAAALLAGVPSDGYRTEFVGELGFSPIESPMQLFALKR